jgi:transaldolase
MRRPGFLPLSTFGANDNIGQHRREAAMQRLEQLYADFGQSVWLDYLDRNLLTRGGLATLIADGVRGVTSNPTIFGNAVAGSDDYDDAIRDLVDADPDIDAQTLYEWLSVRDAQQAADLLAPVFETSEGTDGFVSLEVDPHLADRADATVAAARHLWRAVDRPNLMIKVPATRPGLAAIETLVAEGIHVNVTLLFSVARYREVQQAYLRGVTLHPSPRQVASVASFFVSRIDARTDPMLDEIGTPEARALRGRIAIANARLAYRSFMEHVASEPFALQARRGARYQRPLWASTGNKDPDYRDVRYVEGLIGADTVTTLPPDTLDAFEAHGELHATLATDMERAQRDIDALRGVGINLSQITQELEQDGVRRFTESYDRTLGLLRARIDRHREHTVSER